MYMYWYYGIIFGDKLIGTYIAHQTELYLFQQFPTMPEQINVLAFSPLNRSQATQSEHSVVVENLQYGCSTLDILVQLIIIVMFYTISIRDA